MVNLTEEQKQYMESYWYCDQCTEEVASENVTFNELHDRCGHPVRIVYACDNYEKTLHVEELSKQELTAKVIQLEKDVKMLHDVLFRGLDEDID